MANTKKLKVQTEEVIEQEAVEVVEETVKPAPKKVNKPKHDPNELILCRSVRSDRCGIRRNSRYNLLSCG